MPKYKSETEQKRAERLAKTCIENDLNQSAVARQEGVSHQAINQRFHQKPVQDCLAKYLDSIGLKRELKKVAKEGLEATKTISAVVVVQKNKPGSLEQEEPEVKEKMADGKSVDFIDIPDHKTRHKFWHDLMQIKGHLKNNGKNGDIHFHFTIEERRAKLEWIDNLRRN